MVPEEQKLKVLKEAYSEPQAGHLGVEKTYHLPIRTANGPTIKRQFEDLFVSRWGAPEVVHTDNGTKFSNRLIEQTCKSLDIVHTTNLVYHAQANRAYQTQARYYDKHRRERHFKVSDLVHKRERVLSNKEKDIAAKLSDKFSGPYKVVRRLSPVVFRLVDAM